VAEALTDRGCRVIQADITPDDLTALDRPEVHGRDSVVFPVLHGTFGEDGQLQQILEERGIVYAGSDAASSRLAMDKHRAKHPFRRAGLLTPDSVLIPRANKPQPAQSEQSPSAGSDPPADDDKIVDKALLELGLPCVVKPNCQGSSIGVVIAATADEARGAVKDTLLSYGDCLIEQYIAGRELTVGILAGRALAVLEIRTQRRFYDYQAKYADDSTEYIFDMGLEADQLMGIQAQALTAFAALQCRDFGRVDLMLDDKGRSFFLEVNTIPGFTSHSLLPKAAQKEGLGMGQMCEEIVRMAHSRPMYNLWQSEQAHQLRSSSRPKAISSGAG